MNTQSPKCNFFIIIRNSYFYAFLLLCFSFFGFRNCKSVWMTLIATDRHLWCSWVISSTADRMQLKNFRRWSLSIINCRCRIIMSWAIMTSKAFAVKTRCPFWVLREVGMLLMYTDGVLSCWFSWHPLPNRPPSKGGGSCH